MYFECYHPSNTYWLLKELTSLLLTLESFKGFTFFNTYINIPSPTIVHTRFNDNWLFVSFYYYYHYYFRVDFFYLVLFFIKWLYIDLLNFLFCKYISSHPTSICPKLVLLPWTLMLTLSISLNRFLLVEIQGMKQLTYLVIMDFTFKTCICAWYKKKH